MIDITFDLLTGYVLGVVLWFTAYGFQMIFRSFRLVGDAA